MAALHRDLADGIMLKKLWVKPTLLMFYTDFNVLDVRHESWDQLTSIGMLSNAIVGFHVISLVPRARKVGRLIPHLTH